MAGVAVGTRPGAHGIGSSRPVRVLDARAGDVRRHEAMT